MGQILAFTRDDGIEGQGKSLAIAAKKALLRNKEVDRIYNEFMLHSAPGTHNIDLHEYFMCKKIPYNIFNFFLLEQFGKHSWSNFEAFVIGLWALLSTSDDLLASYCFHIFDTHRSNSIEYFEVSLMLNLIYEFSPPQSALDAIAPLANNHHSIVTLPEFVLLCRHYPVILKPLVTFRDALKRCIIFPRFWNQIAARRVYNYGDKPHYSIIDTITVDEQLVRLRHFLLRNPHIDQSWSNQWLEVVDRKPMDIVEKLPFEIDPDYESPELPSPTHRPERFVPPPTSVYKEKRELALTKKQVVASGRSGGGSVSSRGFDGGRAGISVKSMSARSFVGGASSSGTAPGTASKRPVGTIIHPQPYVARKGLKDDDRDVKKLLRKIKKEVKKRRAMFSQIHATPSRSTQFDGSIVSADNNSILSFDDLSHNLVPEFHVIRNQADNDDGDDDIDDIDDMEDID